MAEVVIRQLASLAECQEAYRLQVAIWGPEQSVPTAQMVVAGQIGGLVLGAFSPGGTLVGFSLAVPAVEREVPYLWSDILAVQGDQRGRGLGKQLKWAQREHALRLGYRLIRWTYDPLQTVNARLNIGALGATSRTYIANFYGEMHDELNRGMPTDRLVADWDLESLTVAGLAAGGAGAGPSSLPRVPSITLAEPGAVPRLAGVNPVPAAPVLLCHIPERFSDLHRLDPETALLWRLGAREALTACFRRGYAITGIAPAGHGLAAYILSHLPKE